ncbi:MAG: ATP-binding cassette domain-containing protein [Planctomycetota bacterium]
MTSVRKTFGKKVAVEGLDLTVNRGALLGLIGPNGAGKTTSIRMIMSILFPDSGELSVLGKNSAIESKDRIGYLPEERGVYKKMKVGAFLRHMAALKGVPSDGAATKINEWLLKVDLPDVAKKKCEELSKGMQQKVQFIAAVLHEPELLILDEPFSGLDPVNMRLLRDLIREQHERGTTVIFSTHVMAQAQDICDRIVMIHQGHKVLDDTISDIRSRHETRVIEFEPLDPSGLESLSIDGVTGTRQGERAWEADIGDGIEPARALASLASAVPVNRAELRRPTLEDVFIGIVTGDGASEEELRAAVRAGAVVTEEEE